MKTIEIDLKEVESLGSRKAVAFGVVSLINDEKSENKDIARVANSDPNLSANILRMANSAYYGLSGHVDDLQFAISVIGFGTVRFLATAAVIQDFVPITREAWKRYLATAGAAIQLAPYFDVDTSAALNGGITLDIGELVIAKQDPYGFVSRMRELEKLPQADRAMAAVEMEARAYGISHPEILARVLKSWKFPQDLYEAVEQHHLEHEPREPLARVLRYAARLSDAILNGNDPAEPESMSITGVSDYEKIIRGARNFMDQMSHQSVVGRFSR